MHEPDLIFIGVAWPYVNGDIHPGHIAGNFLPADIFARFNRFLGKNVLMVSGSDCFGTPITVEADKKGLTPEAVVAEYHPHHLELFKTYGISFDNYTQTTTANHQEVVEEMLLKLAKNGYLIKKTTEQYYSPEEAKFLPDRYVEGTCSYCGYTEARGDQCDQCGRVLDVTELKNPVNKLTRKAVELKETEHLFLNWPKLQSFLKTYIKQRRKVWKDWVYNEAAGWLKKGLKERPITRDINWGVTIPNDKLPESLRLKDAANKRIYVWFEAVIGYLSAARETGENWQNYWFPENKKEVVMYNFMGKDNVVFHTLFWPGQLYGAYGGEVKLPDIVAANQYLNLEGQKFSKSRGVTIDSVYLGKTYGADPVRFYLTYIMPENNDADFSWEDFVKFNNTVLIGTLGNYFNRVFTLAANTSFGKKTHIEKEVKNKVKESLELSKKQLLKCEFKLFSQTIIELAKFGNVYVNQKAPWKIADKTSAEYVEAMANMTYIALGLYVLLAPLTPETYEKLAHILGVKVELWPFGDVHSFFENLLHKMKIKDVSPLFAKIDPERIDIEKSKLAIK